MRRGILADRDSLSAYRFVAAMLVLKAGMVIDYFRTRIAATSDGTRPAATKITPCGTA